MQEDATAPKPTRNDALAYSAGQAAGSQEPGDDVKGFEPAQGFPRDARPGEAATGGAAASLAPLAAAVASGGSEQTAKVCDGISLAEFLLP